MAEERDLSHVRNPHVRHERRQIHAATWALCAAAMVAMAVLIHFSVSGLFNALKGHYTAIDQPPNPILMNQPRQLPPEPRLQPNPVADLQKLRAAEDHALDSYGWVDKSAGVVRIPISRAMQLVAQRGLPQTAPATQQPAASAPAEKKTGVAKGKR